MSLIQMIPMIDVPDVSPEQPDGMDGLMTILNYVAWGVTVVCVLGFLVSLGLLVFGAWNGREMQGMKGIFISLLACVGLGAVSGIFAAI